MRFSGSFTAVTAGNLLAALLASLLAGTAPAVPAAARKGAEAIAPPGAAMQAKKRRKSHATGEEEPSRADLLDGLLARLHMAGDAPEAKTIARSIRELWAESGSPTADLLVLQAGKALKGNDAETALRILDLVVRRWPDYVEAWNRRAGTRYMTGDAEGALKDLDRVLELEPRHFEALFMKGAILEELKRPKDAMAAYEEALSVWPGMKPAKEALRRLRLELDQET